MGLDQYAYSAASPGQKKVIDLAYWRKHPNLHGWMERLWLKKLDVPKNDQDQFIQNKYPPTDFNGVELELKWEDIIQLESDILNGSVSKLNTTGFFFGTPSDDHYREYDLKFILLAKAELFTGLKVFYNSSW